MHFISLFRSSNIWNSYIHHYFIFIFVGYTTKQFHDQLPALHRYRRGQDSNPGKPDFFHAFFS